MPKALITIAVVIAGLLLILAFVVMRRTPNTRPQVVTAEPATSTKPSTAQDKPVEQPVPAQPVKKEEPVETKPTSAEPAPTPGPRDPLLDNAKIGPFARNWIATRLLYIATLPDSAPCTIRIAGIDNPVRIRATWNAPGGPPKDPPFLTEMENFWRAKVQKVVVYHTVKLAKKLEVLREEALAALPQDARKSLAEFYPATELQYGVQWKAWLKVSSGKIDKNDWVLVLPKPGVRHTWMLAQKLDGLAGDKLDADSIKKLEALEVLEIKAWEDAGLDLIKDVANLSGATESMALEQFGKEHAPVVKQAFAMRRLAERQVAQTRLKVFLGVATHTQLEAEIENRKEATLLINEEHNIYNQDKLRDIEAELRRSGLVRLTPDKIELPKVIPAFRSPALWLNELDKELNGPLPEKPLVPEKF